MKETTDDAEMIGSHAKCTRSHVPSAEPRQRYPSSLMGNVQSTAKIATKQKDQRDTNSISISNKFNYYQELVY